MIFLAGARNGRETRRRIVEAVRKNPGVNKSDLARKLGHSWGTMSHHIQSLSRRGELRPFRDGRELLLFPPDIPGSQLRQLAALQGEAPVAILGFLRRNERGIQELCTLVGKSRKVVRKILHDMDEAGLVARGPGLHGKFFIVESEWANLIEHPSAPTLELLRGER